MIQQSHCWAYIYNYYRSSSWRLCQLKSSKEKTCEGIILRLLKIKISIKIIDVHCKNETFRSTKFFYILCSLIKLSSPKLFPFIFYSQKCLRTSVFLHLCQHQMVAYFSICQCNNEKESNFISSIISRFRHLFKF